MKKARIINGTAWAVIGVALIILVCYCWKKQGCGWDSLTMAIVQYASFSTCFWWCFDNHIKEHYQNTKL